MYDVEMNIVDRRDVPKNTVVIDIFEGKKRKVNETVFVTFKTPAPDSITNYRYLGYVSVGNFRSFLKELEGFGEHDETARYTRNWENCVNGWTEYSFERTGTDDYIKFHNGDEVITCLLCGDLVYAEQSFLCFNNFAHVENADLHLEDAPRFDCIHHECVPRFVDILREKFENLDDDYMVGSL